MGTSRVDIREEVTHFIEKFPVTLVTLFSIPSHLEQDDIMSLSQEFRAGRKKTILPQPKAHDKTSDSFPSKCVDTPLADRVS
jgi:hypothetical protein